MKTKTVKDLSIVILLIVTFWSVLLTGCADSNTPQQAVVTSFNTDQVKPVPHRTRDFIVKDNTDSIWYVETALNGQNSDGKCEWVCIRNTMIFKGTNKIKLIDLETPKK